MIRVSALILSLVALAAANAGASVRTTPSCKGSQLAGTFNVVRGSAGAGNISYVLGLRNISATECSVTGLPLGRLLGKTGKALPTHVKAAFPAGLTAVLVRL